MEINARRHRMEINARRRQIEINAPFARAYDFANIKVDGTRITASTRLSMAGMNFTIYASGYPFIHYMIKNMLPGSYHHITGVFSASAYISQTSTRAMLSIRVRPTLIEPVSVDRSTTPSDAIQVTDTPTTTTSKKLEFLIHLYCLQEWENCETSLGDKVVFAEKLISLYERLHQEDMIIGPGAVSPPVSIQDATLETRSSLRPGTKKTTVKEVVLGTYPAVNMKTNMDDSPLVVPLPPPPPSPEQQQQQQQHHHQQEPMLD
ncbi:uncharacterized protein EV154DRAFT_568885 [Mucor mucedo]|uniref:uncharacterized protein n=1 Tax=Mucor mucedo TaxID=29922 RepID=UPI00221E6760|nr:uncharacterized protein EV154DRAFT_568885 [Mucor mucedo]KAI7878542.1 hypothetical protein EV154DRAFT_568885 [Mucor mucedo]